MTLKEFSNRVATRLGVSQVHGGEYVNAVIDEMIIALENGEEFNFPGFAVFSVVETNAREGYDFTKGENVIFPAHYRTNCRFSKLLRDKVKENL